ncbi:AI-2E family transporter [Vibrio splendidus]|nr:AI-2E family transporter [Vibrio splendidus]MCC4880463.1 AI-2E family transporter [Vibrio splendidus]
MTTETNAPPESKAVLPLNFTPQHQELLKKRALAPYTDPLLIIAATTVIIGGMREASDIITPLLLAIFLAVLCNPIVDKMEKHKIPRTIGSLITVLFLCYSLFVLGDVIASSSKGFVKDMQSSIDVVLAKVKELSGDNESLVKSQLESVNVGSVLTSGLTVLNKITSSISFTFMVAFTTFLALCEGKDWQKKFNKYFGSSKLSDGASTQIQTYIYVKSIASLGTGLIIASGLWAIGHQYWLLWGIIATALNFIPNIGSILAAIPAVIVSAATLGLIPTIGTLIIYVVVNVIIGSYLEPKAIGDKLGLSTLIIFLSMVWFGWIFGIVGAFLSVPILVLLKIAIDVTKPGNKVSQLLD